MLKTWRALPNEVKWSAVIGPLVVGLFLLFAIPAIKDALSTSPGILVLPLGVAQLENQPNAGGATIDIKLINRQTHVVVVTGVRLELIRAGVLAECPYRPIGQNPLTDSGGPYSTLIPSAISVKQHEDLTVATLREIQPDQADRFPITIGERYAEDEHEPRATLWNARLRLLRAGDEPAVLLGSVAFVIASKGLTSHISEQVFGGGEAFLESRHKPSYS